MPRRIVFVCTGNSCRSPLAEVLARARYAELPLTFASAGTDAVPGRPASDEACAAARELGLDLAAHRSAPLDAAALAGAGWAIGMTRTHAALLRSRAGTSWGGKVGLLALPGHDWRRDGVPAGFAAADVADPWRQGPEAYRATARTLDSLLAAWAGVFRELAGERGCRQ